MRAILSALLFMSATAHATGRYDSVLTRQAAKIPGMVVKEMAKQGVKITRKDVRLAKLQVGNGTIAIPFSSGKPSQKLGYFRGKALIIESENLSLRAPSNLSVRYDASVTTEAKLRSKLRANPYAFDTY